MRQQNREQDQNRQLQNAYSSYALQQREAQKSIQKELNSNYQQQIFSKRINSDMQKQREVQQEQREHQKAQLSLYMDELAQREKKLQYQNDLNFHTDQNKALRNQRQMTQEMQKIQDLENIQSYIRREKQNRANYMDMFQRANDKMNQNAITYQKALLGQARGHAGLDSDSITALQMGHIQQKNNTLATEREHSYRKINPLDMAHVQSASHENLNESNYDAEHAQKQKYDVRDGQIRQLEEQYLNHELEQDKKNTEQMSRLNQEQLNELHRQNLIENAHKQKNLYKNILDNQVQYQHKINQFGSGVGQQASSTRMSGGGSPKYDPTNPIEMEKGTPSENHRKAHLQMLDKLRSQRITPNILGQNSFDTAVIGAKNQGQHYRSPVRPQVHMYGNVVSNAVKDKVRFETDHAPIGRKNYQPPRSNLAVGLIGSKPKKFGRQDPPKFYDPTQRHTPYLKTGVKTVGLNSPQTQSQDDLRVIQNASPDLNYEYKSATLEPMQIGPSLNHMNVQEPQFMPEVKLEGISRNNGLRHDYSQKSADQITTANKLPQLKSPGTNLVAIQPTDVQGGLAPRSFGLSNPTGPRYARYKRDLMGPKGSHDVLVSPNVYSSLNIPGKLLHSRSSLPTIAQYNE